EGYAVVGINARSRAIQSSDCPRRRDELWFTVAEMARRGELDLSRLSDEVRDKLQAEAMAPKYALDAQGRRCGEPKGKTKPELGCRRWDGWRQPRLRCSHLLGINFITGPSEALRGGKLKRSEQRGRP